jgi:hypothetical protein
MPNDTVFVTFSAPEHSGKTILEAAFAKILAEHGIEVHMPPDPQRAEKLALGFEELVASFKAHGLSVTFMEDNTAHTHR